MATRKRRATKRGLRGTSSEHSRAFAQHVQVARMPATNGCRDAIESLGAAKAHYTYVPVRERDAAHTALVKAGKAIRERCVCRKDG